jgi:hypothetical protein
MDSLSRPTSDTDPSFLLNQLIIQLLYPFAYSEGCVMSVCSGDIVFLNVNSVKVISLFIEQHMYFT